MGGGVDFYKDVNGKEIHSRIMSDYRLEYPNKNRDEICEMFKWTKIQGTYKHRYFYFIGTKKEKKLWLQDLEQKYKITEYPKGDNVRYDASYKTSTQNLLF